MWTGISVLVGFVAVMGGATASAQVAQRADDGGAMLAAAVTQPAGGVSRFQPCTCPICMARLSATDQDTSAGTSIGGIALV